MARALVKYFSSHSLSTNNNNLAAYIALLEQKMREKSLNFLLILLPTHNNVNK